MTGSGGVSVRAGPSPRLGSGRAQLRRLQRRALHKGPGGGGDPLDPDEAGFTCAVVCGSCGHLQWPDHRNSPHRREADAGTSGLPPCTNCGDQAWIDLAPESTAFELRKSERTSLGFFRHRKVQLAMSVVFGAWLGFWLGGAIGDIWPLLGLPAGLLTGTGAALGMYALEKKALGEAPKLPARWTMALPPAELRDEPVRGIPLPKGDLLTAPITGRPCFAYEVGIRDTPDADGKLPTWILLEQRVVDFELDGQALDGSSVHLDLDREYLGSPEDLDLEDAAKIFLRQRGFGPTTPAPHVYETIVAADAEIVVQRGPQRSVLRMGPKALAAATPSTSTTKSAS